jgi:hypothetical protein
MVNFVVLALQSFVARQEITLAVLTL